MTMSISSAPAATASLVSCSLTGRVARPDGKAVETAATWIGALAQRGACDLDHVVVDAHGGDGGCGGVARVGPLCLGAQRAHLAGSVGALQRGQVDHRGWRGRCAYALAVVLIERVPRSAARASAPTWSTPGRPCRKRRSDESEDVTSRGRPVVRVTQPGYACRLRSPGVRPPARAGTRAVADRSAGEAGGGRQVALESASSRSLAVVVRRGDGTARPGPGRRPPGST